MRRVLSDRLEAAARSQLAERVDSAVADGTARPGIDADTVMDVIAGGAWYAVCVRHVKDVNDVEPRRQHSASWSCAECSSESAMNCGRRGT